MGRGRHLYLPESHRADPGDASRAVLVVVLQTFTLRGALSVLLLLAVAMAFRTGATAAAPTKSEPTLSGHNVFSGGATAAIAVDLTTGIELYSYNADVQVPPASTIKLITALVAKDVLPADQIVVVQVADIVDPEEFSVMGLMPGDTISVEALLYGLLLPSGGDAAMALARAGGVALDPAAEDPVKRFVAEMNNYAASLGMTQTRIANPTGADDPGRQLSTARDLVRAAEAVLSDWMLSRIVGTAWAIVEVGGEDARSLELVTSNLLLDRDDIFGIKTGTEDAAGECLIAGVWRGDNQIITVVMGSTDRYADMQELINDVDGRYRWVALGVGTRSIGATDELAAVALEFRTRRTVLMSPEQADGLTWELWEKPDGGGPYAGIVRFSSGGREVAQIPVY